MAREVKIGLIGLDTSHVTVFTKLLNDSKQEYHVPGGRIVAAFPGGSPDFESSISRVEGYTNELRDDYDIAILDSPEAVAEHVDAIMLTSVDGRAHLPLFQAIAPFGKPVFIDKPLTTSSDDAQAIAQLAHRHDVKLMSCSSLRYSQSLCEALLATEPLIGADCCGAMALQPTQPGLFWYGIHTVEMLYAALGQGCLHVTATTNEDHDFVIGLWSDGRIGTVRGNRAGNYTYGAFLHGPKKTEFVDAYQYPKPGYAGLLEHVIPMFQGGAAPIDFQESLEIVRFIEAANESRETGKTVALGVTK